ncbi:hypothetical protein, partial [Tabrizicola sp.]|uniref:hypothetical protein n=1 Tax=Tabrizicola sp. TaxID=2005166 RepID=UPI003F2BC673
ANAWLDDEYRSKGDNRGRLAMAHVWVIPNPDGVFADHNRTLAYLKLGLPADYAEGASVEAALGLMLATPSGCDEFIDPDAWIANLPGSTVRQLKDGCGQMGDYVKNALGGSKAEINAAAEAGWRGFDKFQNELLTDDQKARIATISEHAGHSPQHEGHDHSGN